MLRILLKNSVTSLFRQGCRNFSNGNGSSGSRRHGSSSFCVMSFGDGSQGALGLPSSLNGIGVDAYEPTRVPGLPPDVSMVSAGHYHSLAVTAQGELWAWGRNDEFQLGRGALTSRWSIPTRVEGLTNVRVRAAFASGVVSAAIDDDGDLWAWGRSKRGQLGLGEGIIEAVAPCRVEALAGQHIVKVSFGWGHALAQTGDGKLFGWGYSAEGRLGSLGKSDETSLLDSHARIIGETKHDISDALKVAEKLVQESMEREKNMPIVWEPCLLEELRFMEVVDMACGLDHSLVLCSDGTLFSGGSNVYGQLGRDILNPTGLLPVDTGFHPVSVSCGLGHAMTICKALAPEGTDKASECLVSWGWNHSGQLGRAGPETRPLVVEGLKGETPVVSLAAGRVHSTAVSGCGEVWVWGCGKNGRLGIGSSLDEPEPVLVDVEEGCHVLQAAAGFDHSLLLVCES